MTTTTTLPVNNVASLTTARGGVGRGAAEFTSSQEPRSTEKGLNEREEKERRSGFYEEKKKKHVLK